MDLSGGYGMHFLHNFVHHSLEVPGLHGRGGIYFDGHQQAISRPSARIAMHRRASTEASPWTVHAVLRRPCLLRRVVLLQRKAISRPPAMSEA